VQQQPRRAGSGSPSLGTPDHHDPAPYRGMGLVTLAPHPPAPRQNQPVPDPARWDPAGRPPANRHQGGHPFSCGRPWRRGARRPDGTFAEALLAVPPSGAGPPAAAPGATDRSSSGRPGSGTTPPRLSSLRGSATTKRLRVDRGLDGQPSSREISTLTPRSAQGSPLRSPAHP